MAHRSVEYVSSRVGSKPWQRTAAFGALATLVAGFLLLALLVVSRPLYTLGLLLVTVLALGAIFIALTSRGTKRKVAVVGAAITGVLVIVGLLFWGSARGQSHWVGPLVLALLVAGTVLERYALQVPPTKVELFWIEPSERVTRHPVLIMNLRSGGGKAEQFDLPAACRELGIEPVILEKGVLLQDLANDAVSRGADALGMAGGDGSLGFVAQVAVDHDLPFVCIPAGTRNHFALDVGLDREDPRLALAAFLSGEERRIDYATINGRMFLNNVSLGVYAAIVAEDSYRDAKVGTTLDVLPQLWSEGGPFFDLQFDVPDHGRLERAAILQISNGPYDPNAPGRRTRLDSGQLGMVTADPQRIADFVNITLLAAVGQQDRSSALWSWSAPDLHVESGQSVISAGIDGETVELEPPLDLASVHEGLRILLPPGSRVGAAEQDLGQRGRAAGLIEVAFGLNYPANN